MSEVHYYSTQRQVRRHTCPGCYNWKSGNTRFCQACSLEKKAKDKSKLEQRLVTKYQKIKDESHNRYFEEASREAKKSGIIPNSLDWKEFMLNYKPDTKEEANKTKLVTQLAKSFLYSKHNYKLETEHTLSKVDRRVDLYYEDYSIVVIGEVKTRFGDSKRLPNQLYTYYKDLRQVTSKKLILYGILDTETYKKTLDKGYATFDLLKQTILDNGEIRLLIINPTTNQASELTRKL